MVDLFLERTFEPPLSRSDVLAMAGRSADCFGLHRVDWCVSLLASGGHRMFCHFRAADAESVRIALRTADADISRLWPGTVHDAPGLGAADIKGGNVLVERSFGEAVAIDDIQAIEDSGAHCLEEHRVTFLRTYFSNDHKRMICLYRAPDAESVRLAQRQANMPLDRVWAFATIQPDS